jgi:hypothetical protein
MCSRGWTWPLEHLNLKYEEEYPIFFTEWNRRVNKENMFEK